MSESHAQSKRTKSGAKRQPTRDKRKSELGRQPPKVTLGKLERVPVRGRGGNITHALRKEEYMNVLDPKTKKTAKAKIVTVVENKANRHYVRMNIITRGAVVRTELGEARVTSRPGQHGMINGVLIQKA